MTTDPDRRPLNTRKHQWAHKLAHFFVSLGMSPNQMSLASILLALLGATAYSAVLFFPAPLRPVCLIAAAVLIQLRLLSNMLDGLMAVEEGKKTPTGAIYNELPDRFADAFFLVAAGYASGFPALGWIAALLAVITAYVRALGGSLGSPQDFCGPMAKPHRMFVLTVISLLAAFFPEFPVLPWGLVLMCAGTAYTVYRRIVHLATYLNQSSHA